MLISAIVTTYRRFDKCRRAIDGIQLQTAPVSEIIVVDNGSSEPEYATLHDVYADAPVPVTVVRLSRNTFLQQPFVGCDGKVICYTYQDSVNVGLCLARGDWFALCHDDDEWMPHRIERQVEFLGKHPDAMILGSHVKNRDESGMELGTHHFSWPGTPYADGASDVTHLCTNSTPLIISSMLVSRRLVDTIGPFADWIEDDLGEQHKRDFWMDRDFLRRASAVTPILRLDEVLGWYEVGNKKWELKACG